MQRISAVLLRLALATIAAQAISFAQTPLERRDGFIPMLWDADQGKLLFELSELDKDVLYFSTVAKGSGSGNVGLEWAGENEGGVIQFHRVGPKVMVVEKNLRFRAGNGGPGLVKSVEASFPDSILASLPIVKSENGKLIVDATPLVVRDSAGFASGSRARTGPEEEVADTTWTFDPARSSIYLPRTKGFPKNTEVEATITYQATKGGARTAPEAKILTARLHYSFVDPPTGYQPRVADPRIGVGSIRFSDFSRPNYEGNEVQWVRRHRLEKKDPTAAVSEPKQKIVYYLDASIPEPTRSAMKDGFRWWSKAFEAAGFKDALEIRDAPLDMDPMDVRYNMIYWVDRDERGYSTGGGLTDPRTGEIIAARVRLESDRVRTMNRFWQSYEPSTGDQDDGAPELPAYSTPETEQQLVLLRQALLTAHEVGHSLGFGHNFTSSMNDRASVMEYPSARLKVVGGRVDLTDAYQKQIGAYDIMMVRYAYTQFAPGQEKAGLDGIIADMRKQGLTYTPSSDPRWNRYDDLADPADYLREVIAQRKVLIDNFGASNLRPGEPYSDLRNRMWMVYLHHRWGIDAGVKYIGGMYQNIVLKGDTLPPTEIVPVAKQREILGLLVDALDPANLTIPEKLLTDLAVPEEANRPMRSGPDTDQMAMATGYAFDQLSAARTVAGIVLDQLFDPQRANRIISFADREQNPLTLPEVIDAVSKKVWSPGATGMNKSLQRQTQTVFVDDLMTLGASPESTPDVKAVVMASLTALHTQLAGMKDSDAVTEAHLRKIDHDLARYLQNPTMPKKPDAPPPVMAPI